MEPGDFLCLWDYKIFTADDIADLMEADQFEQRLIDIGLAGWNAVGIMNGCLLFKRPIVRAEDIQEVEGPELGREYDDCRGCVKFEFERTDETGRQHGFCKHHKWETSHSCDKYSEK